MGHSDNGENMAWQTVSSETDPAEKENAALGGVDRWYNEVKMYNEESRQCLGPNPVFDCGHYTQVITVWRSQYMG